MKNLLNILFWSVISAAFIGPGTVTTAASAGARFGYSLLWALLFSTVATLVLQEATARLTVVSGFNLGEAIQRQYSGGVNGLLVLLLVLGAVVFGCAAYEAGNILGGVSGAVLGTDASPKSLTVIMGALASVVLWIGTPRTVAYLLSLVVAFMGVAFLITAILLKPPVFAILNGSFTPAFPTDSGLLILGLIGTTVVPYNLFLGSGIAAGQTVKDLRVGLTVSILLGGLISMAVLIVGAAVVGNFDFTSLATALATKLGDWSSHLFALGLFAAGFSSAITAPLAAAITARSLFEKSGQAKWHEKSWRYRTVWLGILLVGIGFGLADVRPIPAIILAQALNGILLPFAAVFLLIVVNDRRLMGEQQLNGVFSNSMMGLVVIVTVVLGCSNVLKAAAATMGYSTPDQSIIFLASGVIALLLVMPVIKTVKFRRRIVA